MDPWWALAGGVLFASLLIVGGGTLLAAEKLRTSRWRRRIVGTTGKGSAAGIDRWRQLGIRLLITWGRRAAPTGTEGESTHVRFLTAGLRSRNAPLLFYGTKVLGATGCPLVLFFLLQLLTAHPWWSNLIMAVAGCLAGWYAPDVWLRCRIASRQTQIVEGFPAALDLLVICVEAGLGLDVALNRVAHEMARMHRELSQELETLCVELRSGRSRQDAFRRAAQRMQVEEVHGFMAVVIQTERFGTSIGQALRIHADGLRTRQDLRATEIASQLPVKLLFPLIFFIFPGLFVILLGPAVIRGLRLLSDAVAP
ncbi:MAG: type II secretion system F family protein [Nitrospira sp.]|jgi:tight adherence protein C|nr:type II secretion system F family protein [Nitrospira sp.]MCW5793866.1 type II secretion system F family protein [Nitrospira sp.]